MLTKFTQLSQQERPLISQETLIELEKARKEQEKMTRQILERYYQSKSLNSK